MNADNRNFNILSLFLFSTWLLLTAQSGPRPDYWGSRGEYVLKVNPEVMASIPELTDSQFESAYLFMDDYGVFDSGERYYFFKDYLIVERFVYNQMHLDAIEDSIARQREKKGESRDHVSPQRKKLLNNPLGSEIGMYTKWYIKRISLDEKREVLTKFSMLPIDRPGEVFSSEKDAIFVLNPDAETSEEVRSSGLNGYASSGVDEYFELVRNHLSTDRDLFEVSEQRLIDDCFSPISEHAISLRHAVGKFMEFESDLSLVADEGEERYNEWLKSLNGETSG